MEKSSSEMLGVPRVVTPLTANIIQVFLMPEGSVALTN